MGEEVEEEEQEEEQEVAAVWRLDTLAHDTLLAISRALERDDDALALAGACRATRDAMREADELQRRRSAAERRLHDRWCCGEGEGGAARGGGAAAGGSVAQCTPLGGEEEETGGGGCCGVWEAHARGCSWLRAVRCGACVRFEAPLERGELRLLLHLLRGGSGGGGGGAAVEGQQGSEAVTRGAAQLAMLVLDSSGVDCRDAAALARLLPSAAPDLARLSLSACEVGDAGAQALAAALAAGAWPRLRDVDLDENPFGGVGRAALRRASRARGVGVSVSSVIENDSLFE